MVRSHRLECADAIGRYMADDWVIVGETGFTDKNDFLALVASRDLTHEAMDGSVKSQGLRRRGHRHRSGHEHRSLQRTGVTSDEWITDSFVKRDGRWLCVLTHLTPAVDRK